MAVVAAEVPTRNASVPNIEELVRMTHDERARQGFVSMLRKHAIIDMRRAVEEDYRARVEPRIKDEVQGSGDWRRIEAAMEGEASHRFYSAMRYNAQEMCYLSVQEPVERARPKLNALAADLARRNPVGGSLTLDRTLEIPRYVSALDVHLAPGWTHREYGPEDVSQGAVVAFGGKVFTGQHPYRKRPGVVGESIAQWVRRRFPQLSPRRLLDMGTTTGKNLLPYCQVFPQAEAFGIDVGAPVLRYAHALAEHEGWPVHYSQQNAERTSFPDGHFDLIVSSFFLHEVPLKATKVILRECLRLLAPGGVMVHMELPNESAVPAYDNFFWNWDTRNNNEPYYTTFRAQEPIELCVEAGFPRERSFAQLIPDYATFGPEKFERFVRGEVAAPKHGSGGWFIFGAQRAT